MHRFFTATENFKEDKVELVGPEVHHLRNVLRLKTGDTIEVLDGKGLCSRVKLFLVDEEKVSGRILEEVGKDRESPLKLTMGLSILKGKAMDVAIRKGVELGVSRVVPVLGTHCVPRVKPEEFPQRVERWMGIVQDAVKQCGRTQVPEITEPVTVNTFCRTHIQSPIKLIFWEDETLTGLADLPTAPTPDEIPFLIGPEGGFSTEELDQARAAGFRSVSLGPRTLRAETVPLVALTLLQYRWGDLSSC